MVDVNVIFTRLNLHLLTKDFTMSMFDNWSKRGRVSLLIYNIHAWLKILPLKRNKTKFISKVVNYQIDYNNFVMYS